jgi:hypothetical protein
MYESKWMSGAEALDYLLQFEPEPRRRIALLQAAVRDGVVKGRRRGIEQDRGWVEAHGLASDPDNIRADETWRRQFIYPDAASLDPAAFAANSEFLREDVLRLWPDVEANTKDGLQDGARTSVMNASDGCGSPARGAPPGLSDRFAGRPSLKEPILQKLARRIAERLECDGVAAESRMLFKWVRVQYPGDPGLPGGPRVVENLIRTDYRRLRGERDAPKKESH